jgi:hypothetical protein
VARKKRLIRSVLRETIAKRSKQELQKYLASPAHKPDEVLIKVAQCENFPINKNKISQIMGAL